MYMYSKAGEYVCEVQPGSRGRKLKRSAFVNVPAVIKVMTLSKQPNPGDNLEMNCQAYGYPSPVVVWGKEGKQLKYDQHIKGVFGDDGLPNATLKFSPYDIEDDGEYTCSSVFNKYGNASLKHKLQHMAAPCIWCWLGPLLGILVFVIVSLVLLAMYLYRRIQITSTGKLFSMHNTEKNVEYIPEDKASQFPKVGGVDFSHQIEHTLEGNGIGDKGVSVQFKTERNNERLRVIKMKNKDTGDERLHVNYSSGPTSPLDELDAVRYPELIH